MTSLGVLGQQRAEVVLQEVLHFLVQRGAVFKQLLQLVDGELARRASAAAASWWNTQRNVVVR